MEMARSFSFFNMGTLKIANWIVAWFIHEETPTIQSNSWLGPDQGHPLVAEKASYIFHVCCST